MKKLFRNAMMLSAMAGTLFFTACDGDEDILPSGPSIEVSTDPALNDEGDLELTVGEDYSITVNATTPAGFNTIRLTSGTTVVEQTRNDLGLDAAATSANAIFEFDGFISAGTASIQLEVVDENGDVATETLDVIVTANLTSFSGQLLAAPVQDEAGTIGSKTSQTFFSTSTGLTYSMEEVNTSAQPLSASIDFGYFYGVNLMATLASPSNYPIAYGQAAWGTRNETKLKQTDLTESQFNEASLAVILTAFDEGTFGNVEGSSSNLQVGDVLAFRTDATKEGGAKTGLILINDIVGTDGIDGRIDFSIIMEE